MSFANIFITGANRGIGLEFARQFAPLAGVKRIFATCRKGSPSDDLKSVDKVKLIELDIKDYDKYEQVVNQVREELSGEGLNLLINNAGILSKDETVASVTRDSMLESYEVNVVAPLLLTRALAPLLMDSAKKGQRTVIINISSIMGSIGEYLSGPSYPSYRGSKAALNQVTKNLSLEYKEDNILAVALHPGWVQTRMGGEEASIDPTTSVSNMIKTIESLTAEQAGLLLNYDGKVIQY